MTIEIKTNPDGLFDADTYSSLKDALVGAHTEDLVNLIQYALSNRDDVAYWNRPEIAVGSFVVPGYRTSEPDRVFEVQIKSHHI